MADVRFNANPRALRKMSEVSFGRIRDLAEDTVSRAVDKSPYDTGNNRDNIKFAQERKGAFIVFTESGYGGWLEIGTERRPATPYIRPAYQEAKQAAERRE
jgi:hypothetical protein